MVLRMLPVVKAASYSMQKKANSYLQSFETTIKCHSFRHAI